MATIGNALNVGVSGILAGQTRLVNAADNIANVRTISGADPSNPGDGEYFANRTLNETTGNGGVTANTVLANPASVQVYDPDAANADAEGFTFIPNVNIENEILETLSAEQQVAANAAVIRTADELADEVIDILA